MDELQKSKNPKNESYILDVELVRQGSMNIWLLGDNWPVMRHRRRQTDHLRLPALTFSSQDYNRLNLTCRPKEGMDISSKSQSRD